MLPKNIVNKLFDSRGSQIPRFPSETLCPLFATDDFFHGILCLAFIQFIRGRRVDAAIPPCPCVRTHRIKAYRHDRFWH